MTGKNAATERSHHESLVRRAEFIDLIRGNPARRQLPLSVRAACDKLKINRSVPFHWKKTDPQFASAYDDAIEDGHDVLEDEALRRAVDGVARDVYYQGEVVGQEQQYSDGLLQFMLAGRRPERYRPNHQINTQVNVQIEQPSDRDVAKALSLLIEEAKSKQA